MAKKINIAQLDIDVDALVTKYTKTRQEIDAVKEAQKKLTEEGKRGSKQFSENEIKLKALQVSYNQQKNVLSKLTNEEKKLISTEQKLNQALNRNVKTIEDARASNKELLALRNKVNLKTKEGQKQLDNLNKKLNENNKFIKANVSEYEKQKIGIGDYEGAIRRVFPAGGGLIGVIRSMKASLIAKRAAMHKATIGTHGLRKAWTMLKYAFISSGIGAILVALGTFAVMVSKSIGKSREFSKEMSNLKSVLGATDIEMQKLTSSAKNLGATTAFTASEVAQLQTEFAKLGFPTDDILNLTASTLDAAAAMGSGLGETAKLTGATLKAFGLDSSKAAMVNDVLADSTTKSALDFGKLQTSMSTIAPVAKAAGFSLQDTVSLLGSLADAGFDASTAATSTRNILLYLADSSSELAQSLSEPVTDLPSMIRAFQELQGRGVNLSEALQLTDKRAVSAFNTFLTGTDALEKLSKALEDAEGRAKEIAEVKLDNLEGDITKLNSAWEGLLLTIEDGEGVFNSVARWFVQFANYAISRTTYQIRAMSFAFQDGKETARLFFTDLVLYFRKMVGNFQLLISKIPIIGDNLVDVEAVQEKLAEITKLEQENEQKKIDRGTYAVRWVKYNNQLIIQDEAKKQAKIAELEDKARKEKERKDAEARRKKEQDDKAQALKEAEKKQAELKRLKGYEDKKLALENEIALRKKETQQERELLRLEQEYEKHVADLERMELQEGEKLELEKLLLENKELAIAEIKEKFRKQDAENTIKANQIIVSSEREKTQIRQQLTQQLTGLMRNLLGDSLAGQLAMVAVEGAIQAGMVKMQSAKAIGNVVSNISAANAQAIATSPLTGGQPWVSVNTKQGALLTSAIKANSTKAISTILASSAIKSAGSLMSKIKYEKGGLQEIGGSRHYSGGTKFVGEDGTAFEAERGELIGVMSREASRHFMAFNNTFTKGQSNSGKFALGGLVKPQGGSSAPEMNVDYIAETIADKINDIKVVTIVDEVTDMQNLKTEIISGSNV